MVLLLQNCALQPQHVTVWSIAVRTAVRRHLSHITGQPMPLQATASYMLGLQ